MKRVLLDQGLAPAAAAFLRAMGWDALHVSEVHLDRAEDEEILEFAQFHNRVCITLDHDFHAHLALTRANGPSVVFLRVEGSPAQQQAELIQSVWSSCAAELEQGCAVSVDGKSIRLRRLPLR